MNVADSMRRHVYSLSRPVKPDGGLPIRDRFAQVNCERWCIGLPDLAPCANDRVECLLLSRSTHALRIVHWQIPDYLVFDSVWRGWTKFRIMMPMPSMFRSSGTLLHGGTLR